MSLFKRRILQMLLRSIKNFKAKDVRQLENNLVKIIQVQPLRKNTPSNSYAQFSVNLSKLEQFLDGHSETWNEVSENKELTAFRDKEWLKIRVDQGQFAKAVLQEIRTSASQYGSLQNRCLQPENICVEYSSPNIAKPFHVGHLRSTIIGNVLANMYEASGHNVHRINFLGDWGTQFGLLSLGLMRFGDLDHLKSDPLLELFNVYVKINQEVKAQCGKDSEMTSPTYQEGMELFSRLEKGDKAMETVWKMVNDLSVAELSKMYERLGVQFTHVMAESSYQQKALDVVKRLEDAGLLQYGTDGVGYVQMPGEENLGRASVVKSDGSSLYLTRDIASALERQEIFSLDRMHYVVDQGQRGHFIKLCHVLQHLDVPWASRQIDELHIRFGRVTGMSTRRGDVVFLRDVLDEAKSRVIESMKERSTTKVMENMEEVGDILGVTCIVLQDLKSHRASDYAFSWERALSMKADSGMFVQYCHARLCSLFNESGVPLTDDIDISVLHDDSPMQNLVLHLARYPDIFSEALNKLEPHHLVQYLFRLCHLVNTAYKKCPVKGQPNDIAQARLLVFDCCRQVMVNVIVTLGLKPLERM